MRQAQLERFGVHYCHPTPNMKARKTNEIPVAIIEEAPVCLLDNAVQLEREARLLFEAHLYPRSFFLSYTCLEELTKIPMLVRAVTDPLVGIRFVWKNLWDKLHSHKRKKFASLGWEWVFDVATDQDFEGKQYLDRSTRLGDEMKKREQALYVDIRTDGVSAPSQMVTRENAAKMLELAQMGIKYFGTIERATQGRLSEIAQDEDFQRERGSLGR